MVIRRRGFVKYLIMIPTLWLGAIILFSLRTDSSPALKPESIFVERIDRSTPKSLVNRIIGALPFNKGNNVDADHPDEERQKAEAQARQMKGQIQVVAPEPNKIHNDPKLGGPGEMGNPVRIDKDKLSMEERKKYDDGWKNNAFNEYVSDMISLRRTLADIRDPEYVHSETKL